MLSLFLPQWIRSVSTAAEILEAEKGSVFAENEGLDEADETPPN